MRWGSRAYGSELQNWKVQIFRRVEGLGLFRVCGLREDWQPLDSDSYAGWEAKIKSGHLIIHQHVRKVKTGANWLPSAVAVTLVAAAAAAAAIAAAAVAVVVVVVVAVPAVVVAAVAVVVEVVVVSRLPLRSLWLVLLRLLQSLLFIRFCCWCCRRRCC